jgi:hypothetical protein
MDEAVGVHVESDGDGDLGAVRPGDGSSDHAGLSSKKRF